MKNLFKFFPAALLLVPAACVSDLVYEEPARGPVTHEYLAVFETATKTELGSNGAVQWQEGDKITYFTESSQATGEFTITTDQTGAPSSMLSFEVDPWDAQYVNAVYGAAVPNRAENYYVLRGLVPAEQGMTNSRKDTSFVAAHVCAARGNVGDTELHFYNLTSILKFTSSASVAKVEIIGNNNEPIVSSTSTVQVTFAGGRPVAEPARPSSTVTVITGGEEKDFYVSVLPVYFTRGFTINMYDANGGLLKTRATKKAVSLGMDANGGLLRSKILYLGKVEDWLNGQDVDPIVPLEDVTLDKSVASISEDEAFSLTATIVPDDAENVTVSWSSDNTAVATVNQNGFVAAVAAGTANITVTATQVTDQGTVTKTATCAVTVTPVDRTPDLSAGGFANSYIAPATGTVYKFLATTKGNGVAPYGEITAIEGACAAIVLWETRPLQSFSDNGIRTGSVVKEVRYSDDGFVYFTAVGAGNALIAVVDQENTILWSWHIWVWPGYVESKACQTYRNGGIMMDRNLGATTSYPSEDLEDYSAFGLLYQWGRKDPFFGRNYTSLAMGPQAGTYPQAEESTAGTGNPEYAAQHPMTYLVYGKSSTTYDWIYGDLRNNLWSNDKTMYDPCPPGWKVPNGSFWIGGLGFTTAYPSQLDHSRNGFDLAGYVSSSDHVFYPFAGSFDGTVTYSYWGGLQQATRTGVYSTTSAPSHFIDVMSLSAMNNNTIRTADLSNRSAANSVRCMKDGSVNPDPGPGPVTPTETEVTDIVLTGGADGASVEDKTIDLTAGKSYQLTATIVPDDATDKSVLWASSQTSVATVSETGLVLAVGPGEAEISVSAKNGVKASCKFTVALGSESDLSADGGPANSYVVPAAGQYCFDAVKGNSQTSVGTVKSVDVLWQSNNSHAAGAIISEVSYSNGKVYFAIPSGAFAGNAVIAAFNANNKVLWSWHIWYCPGYFPDATAQEYSNGAKFMDRYLGALTANSGDVTAYGLMYQWGRKDPFLGSAYIHTATNLAASVSSLAHTDITWRNLAGPVTQATADANPMTFYYNSTGDWLSTRDQYLWRAEDGGKTIHDPCPPGWRVPVGGPNGTWAGAASSWEAPYEGNPKYGVDFAGVFTKDSSVKIWYPSAGYRSDTDGSLQGTGSYMCVWTATPYSAASQSAYYLYHTTTSDFFPGTELRAKSYGCSVRCMKE